MAQAVLGVNLFKKKCATNEMKVIQESVKQKGAASQLEILVHPAVSECVVTTW